jgi:hypothetical protein
MDAITKDEFNRARKIATELYAQLPPEGPVVSAVMAMLIAMRLWRHDDHTVELAFQDLRDDVQDLRADRKWGLN